MRPRHDVGMTPAGVGKTCARGARVRPAHLPRPCCVVGFAAGTGGDAERACYARDKTGRKRVDVVGTNRVGGSGFKAWDSAPTAFWNGG